MARKMSQLILSFPSNLSLKWFKAGINNLMEHWINIDHHRHNKFLFLIRTHMHEMLANLKKCQNDQVF